MILPIFLLVSNPFIQAYAESDLLGKAIFISLYLLSCVSWAIIIQKSTILYQIKRERSTIEQLIQKQKSQLLHVEVAHLSEKEKGNPFFQLYATLKKNALELLNKNRHFTSKKEKEQGDHPPFLSEADIGYLEVQIATTRSSKIKELDKNLFLLSTAVTLAPFLGLLGTVWGILATFSEMQNQASAHSTSVLAGLSLALATTVVGLIVAIPALIGYNILKNHIRELDVEMGHLSQEMVAAIELQFRKVDVD